MAARPVSPSMASTRGRVSKIKEMLNNNASGNFVPIPARPEWAQDQTWERSRRVKALREAFQELAAEGVVVNQHAVTCAEDHVLLLPENSDDIKLKSCARKHILSLHATFTAYECLLADGIQDEIFDRDLHAARRAAGTAADAGAGINDMVARASAVLKGEKQSAATFVATVLSYKAEGVDLIISWSNLAGTVFESRLRRGNHVSDLADNVHKTKLREISAPTAYPKTVSPMQVSIIGPRGTPLDWDMPLPEALDYESDNLAVSDDDEGDFYPLEVLTGQAWRDMGLHGATRWKYLREAEFMKLFGMSKASFQELPSWKQVPLKKKHGLF